MKRLLPLIATTLLLSGCAEVIRNQIYHPSAMAPLPIWSRAPASVSVVTADGLKLNGLYWAPEGAHRDILVYFHGNGGNLNRDGAYAEPLAREGRGLLMTSYRGYSGNPGRPTEAGLAADADVFVAQARALLPEGGELYLFGHSLGGAVALSAAARTRVDGVATLGTFGRTADLAPAIARGVIPDRFDNRAAIARVDAPVTLFHGTADTVVPFDAAESLKKASGNRARVVPLDGGGHHPSMARLAPYVWAALEGRALPQ